MAKLCTRALEAEIEVEYVQELICRLRIVPDRSPIHLENWPWYLKVFTLGRFELLKDGKPAQFSRKVQQKPLSLLKVLIALGGREIKEDQIADILWPEADGDAAHHAFVSTLHRLRQLIGYEKALHFREGKISLDDRYFWVDAWALEHIWEQADVCRKEGRVDISVQLAEKAIAMYRGPFLSGETEEPWMVSLRERLRNKFLTCVNRLGRYWQQVGQEMKAVECYQRGLDADDLAEEFYQGLMICHQRLNQEAEARAVYHRCRKILSSAIGVEPSPKTEAIYQSLMKNVTTPGQTARTFQRLP
jgi:LuxR family transcriptional regulator, maltose regulon positive regulatory protein